MHVRSKLDSSRLFVVSNREPYMHTKDGKTTRVVVPASGLVTALEPILRACDGTWIAHGSGSGRYSSRNNYVAERLREAGIATLLLDLLTPEEERDRRNVFDIELLATRLHVLDLGAIVRRTIKRSLMQLSVGDGNAEA